VETLVDFLKEISQKYTSATALSISMGVRQRKWSYSRLWDLSARVSSILEKKGLVKGDQAIIWGPNCPEWVVAFLGCARAGVVAVPLDVRSAPDFVTRVMDRTSPKLAIVSRSTRAQLPREDLDTLLFEELEELMEETAPREEEPTAAPDDIVELMFTSGTTGEPKGVMLTHRNLLSNTLGAAAMVQLKPNSRMLSLMPLSHMLEQTGGLLVPLYYGANLVYATSRQPSIIFKTLQTNHITAMILVPQALQLFMNAIEREVRAQGKEKLWGMLMGVASVMPNPVRRRLFRQVHHRLGGCMSFMFSGGAALDPELGRKWNNLGIPVLQAYGTTETAPLITTNTFRNNREGSVGKTPPGQDVRIAEDGEVLTRGPNVTPGYWQNNEATDAAFEDGWYKTGDLGLLDDDGYLYLKGRKKDLIVLANGQNVYPEDIEAIINNQPGVKDSVVLGLQTESGDVSVHAALLMEDETDSDPGSVVRSANQILASHQQVQGFTLWPEEDFPRTHTLKIRKPLVLDFLTSTEQQRDSQPETQNAPVAGTALQRLIASVCNLPLEELTPEKSLGLDLNLDSLGRVELLSAIEEELGARVDEEQLNPTTTVAELERLVDAGGAALRLPFPSWGRTWWCSALRAFLQSAFVFPLMHVLYRVKITGQEQFQGLEGPLLFASNHNVKMDNPLIIMAMPIRWRRRLSPAAAADFMLPNPLWRIGAPLLGNAFPFSREGAIRPSLENLGLLLDWGWSILIYPEGQSNRNGVMESFKPGAGLVAVEGRTQVVPIRVVLNKRGVFDHGGLLTRGDVEIRFGKPIVFARKAEYREATEQLEAAVREL
jgi:long-chain acyl-CoA synthetase